MLDEAETTLTSIDQASERLVQNVLKQAQTAKPSHGQQQQLHKAAAPPGLADDAACQPMGRMPDQCSPGRSCITQLSSGAQCSQRS